MELINRLPFPAMAFRQFDIDGRLDCVVAVRGTFQHSQGQPLEIMQEQEEFQWEDAYDDDPHKGVLLRQTDLTPEKPGTDITFLGNAHAPGGQPSTSWPVEAVGSYTFGRGAGDMVQSLRRRGAGYG